jgi:hypothetical protein
MRLTIVGIIGFVVMLGSAYLGLTAWRGQSPSSFRHHPSGTEPAPGLTVIPGGKKPRRQKATKPQGSMMDRFEERWRRRREGGQGY